MLIVKNAHPMCHPCLKQLMTVVNMTHKTNKIVLTLPPEAKEEAGVEDEEEAKLAAKVEVEEEAKEEAGDEEEEEILLLLPL